MSKKDKVDQVDKTPTEREKTLIIISLLISALGAPPKSSTRATCLTEARSAVDALLGDEP